MKSSTSLYSSLIKKIKSDDKKNLQEKILNSKTNEIREICENLENIFHLTKKDIIGLGTSCFVFKYGHDQVIKVCSKNIKYFSQSKKKLAINFQKEVRPLYPYLLPIKDIVFDGRDFFVYIQDRCQPLEKKSSISPLNFVDILTIIRVIFSHNLLVGQLKPKNVGYLNSLEKSSTEIEESQMTKRGSRGICPQLVLFDYHSMHHLHDRMEDKKDWWKSLDDSLKCYSRLFSKNQKKKIIIHSLEKFRKYIREVNSRDIDLKKIDELLENTQKEILESNI
jgi:hypothetical protein